MSEVSWKHITHPHIGNTLSVICFMKGAAGFPFGVEVGNHAVERASDSVVFHVGVVL